MRQMFLRSASLLVLLSAGQAIAQIAPRTIQLGQTVSGSIGPEDPKLESDNSSYEVYRVQVPAGRQVTATLTSSAFQPVLGLGPTITEECDGCTIDIGESDKPAIVTRLSPDTGTLEIRVNTMNEGDRGPFTLLVNAVVPARLSARPLLYGQGVSGELAANDAVTGDGLVTDAYALRLTAGQNVQIDLSSTDFDPKLELLDPSGTQLSEDDDSGPGTNARIRFRADRAGVYQIRATPVGSGGLGSYTLRAGARPPVVAMPAPRPVVIGQVVAGAITTATPVYETDGEETAAVRYSFNASLGSVYRITVDAPSGSELDPKVSVGKLDTSGSFDDTASDDDGGGDKNAMLRFRPSASGIQILEVSPVGDGKGAYNLQVRQLPPDRAPSPAAPVAIGGTVKGVLSDGGARQSDGDRLFNSYSVALKAGQKVTLRLDKDGESNLDPVIMIGRGSPNTFEKIAEDDDGGAELNARLRFVAPADGTYAIRATTASSTGEGAYVLSIADTPPPVAPPAPETIKLGETKKGSLSTADPMRDDKTYYDRFVFNGKVGETYEIRLEAEDFDAIVGARQIERVDDDYVTDDDSGGGTNAKLSYTITTDGPQIIRVTSVGEESIGDYSLLIIKK